MRKFILIISLFLIIAQGFAQEDSNAEEVTLEEAHAGAKGLMKELFMFEMAKDAIETRQLISDNELGDSVEKHMTDYDNALFFKSKIDYDCFWNNVLGRKKYKVPSSQIFLDSKEKYLENNEVGTSIDFDIVLKPNWEDPDKEDKVKDYSVKITPDNYTNISFSEDEEENFNSVLNSPFATNVTTPKDAKVNEAIFDGLAALRNKLDSRDVVPEINMAVNFAAYKEQLYGFDKLTYDVHKPTYQQLKINGKDQYLPWKSISSSVTDQVLVKFSDYDETITPDEIKYKTSSGINLTATKLEGKDNVHLLSLTGKSNEVVEEIIAYVKYKNSSGTEKDIKVGSLNTITYDKLKINLVILPVNGAAGFSADDFTKNLNEIYKQSVVEWNVTLDEEYKINESEWDEDGDHAMNDGESTFLSNYSDEQKNFKSQYKKDRDVDKNSYYVFLLNNIPSKSGLKGYMPLKEQYAFIHSANSTNAAQLIAHELGHGAFRLWHTFSSESSFFMAKNSSNNLMDYKDSTHLHKYQWDKVHNPDGGFYMFQDEEEGASVDFGIIEQVINNTTYVRITDISCHSFFTPAGKPISFNQEDNLFITELDFQSKTENNISVPLGVLFKFKLNDERFRAHYSKDAETGEWEFIGYKNDSKDEYYKESITKSFEIPYKINIYSSGSLVTNDCEWDLNSQYLFPISTEDYIGKGNVVNDLELRPCGYLYDKYYPTLSKSGVLRTVIDKDPCVLMGMHPMGEGLGYETEFMKGLNTMVNAGLAVAFFPAVLEILAPVLIESVEILGEEFITTMSEKVVQDKLTDFAKGVAFDATIQALTLYYFDEVEPDEILARLDYAQMALTGAENTINDTWGKIIADAVSPLYDAFTEEGKFKEDLNVDEFLNDYTVSLFVNILFDKLMNVDGLNHSFKRLKDIFTNTPSKFISGLDKIGLTKKNKALAIYNFERLSVGDSHKMLDVDHIFKNTSIASKFNEIKVGDITLRAGTLWNKKGGNINHVLSSDGNYYIKHDLERKDLILYDVEQDEALGYYFDEDNLINNNYDNILIKLELLHQGGSVPVTSIGKVISSTAGVTTTVLGSYVEDISKIIEATGNLKNLNFDAKKGGYNVLNVPNSYFKNSQQFWDDYNRNFLDKAITRSDKIVLATNPLRTEKVFKLEDVPTFENILDMKEYILKVDFEDLTGFGRELKYLFEEGYIYDINNNIFNK